MPSGGGGGGERERERGGGVSITPRHFMLDIIPSSGGSNTPNHLFQVNPGSREQLCSSLLHATDFRSSSGHEDRLNPKTTRLSHDFKFLI